MSWRHVHAAFAVGFGLGHRLYIANVLLQLRDIGQRGRQGVDSEQLLAVSAEPGDERDSEQLKALTGTGRQCFRMFQNGLECWAVWGPNVEQFGGPYIK